MRSPRLNRRHAPPSGHRAPWTSTRTASRSATAPSAACTWRLRRRERREIKILRILGDLGAGKEDNNNIVKLIDVVSSNTKGSDGDVYMVFEYCDHDLTGLLEAPEVKFTDAQVKYYLYEIISGLAFCHKNSILHRDIKGANILISNTNRVVTLW
jgi:serine/threonine protein kinase